SSAQRRHALAEVAMGSLFLGVLERAASNGAWMRLRVARNLRASFSPHSEQVSRFPRFQEQATLPMPVSQSGISTMAHGSRQLHRLAVSAKTQSMFCHRVQRRCTCSQTLSTQRRACSSTCSPVDSREVLWSSQQRIA